MSSSSGNGADSSRSNRFTALLILVCVSVLAVWGAATRGPITIDPPAGREPADPDPITNAPPIEEIVDEPLFEVPDEPESVPLDLSGLITALKWIGIAILAIAVVIVILRIVAEFRRTRDSGEPSDLGRVHTTTASELHPDLSALESAVHAAQGHLAENLAPSDAIIAAWVAIEHAASLSGVPKEPWHTTSEFTVWVLSHAELDHQALQELMALYHRARFSTHTPGSPEVEQARALLTRIQTSWSVA